MEQIDAVVPPRASRGQGGGSLPEIRRSQKSPSRVDAQESDRRVGSEVIDKRDSRKTLGSVPPYRKEGEREQSQEEGLFELLDSYRDIVFFRAFLRREFIEELLDFYLGVDEWREQWLRFKDKPKSSKLRKARTAAVELYRTFLSDDGPRLINIPMGERLYISEAFAPIATVLGLAQPGSPSPDGSSFMDFAALPPPTDFSKPMPPLKLPKPCPELEQLELTFDIFNTVQYTTFNMMLEPYVRFLEDSSLFRQMQTDRLKRPINGITSRRAHLKTHRPISFDDIAGDTAIQTAFRQVLKKEYSEDYLAFFLTLSAFANSKSLELNSWATEIYDNYIGDERVYIGPSEVYALQSRLKSGHVDRHCFDMVRFEVEAILKTKFSDNCAYIHNEVNKLRRRKLT